jgi:hypothetical protein
MDMADANRRLLPAWLGCAGAFPRWAGSHIAGTRYSLNQPRTRQGGDHEKIIQLRALVRLRPVGRRGVGRTRRRRHLRAPAQSRAAQLAHEPPRLRLAALLGAGQDRQVERQESQAGLRGRARRYLAERISRGDAAGRRRLHVHDRRLGRGLQDRRTLGHPRPHPVEDGPRPAEAGPQPRRRAVEQSRDLGHRARRPRHCHRQGDRQDRVGQEPARPGGDGNHSGAAGAQGHHHRRRLRRRQRRALLGGVARRQDRRAEMEDLRGAGARRARQ